MTDDSLPSVWSVAKLRPDGSVAARYQAHELPAPPGWIGLRANWVYGRVDIGYFAFEPGDVLDEYFALDGWYNAFATFRGGTFVGWYCNVTYPTIVRPDRRELDWHDLYVDILVTADGTVHVVDEDELAASGLAAANPELHAAILHARDELLTHIRTNTYPFAEVPLPATTMNSE